MLLSTNFSSILCTKDGDYNRDIPAQRNSKLNVQTSKNHTSFTSNAGSVIFTTTPPKNGLCILCNRNQEIKIQQLASFEPEDPDNYDEEIELFK